MSTTALMALNPEWVQSNTTAVMGAAGITSEQSSLTFNCYPSWVEHYQYPHWSYPVYISSPSRPIKLTLREVELLREAAQRDSRVRTILEKFTLLIEVSVSFEDR